MKRIKGQIGVAMATTVLLLSAMMPAVQAKTVSATALTKPHAAAYGYYVDHYKENVKANTNAQTNPAYGVLSGFQQLWSPTKGALNPTILAQNVNITAVATQHRSAAEVKRSFLTDVRNLPYSILAGLGPFEQAFITNAHSKADYDDVPAKPIPAGTKIPNIPWGDPQSSLGDMVQLVNLARQSYGGTGVPKSLFKYVRPYRQSKDVIPNPYSADLMKAAPQNDYDMPSGHATAGFETGELLGYAFPERYQQLITRSSEMGYDRLLAGRHTPLAVMGSRMIGTAVAASVLNDPQNQALMKRAVQQAHSTALQKSPLITTNDDFKNYQTNRQNYRYRLTYGLPQIGRTDQAMRVPKGAEVLLATRLPYLSGNQRRMVLATTGIASGYPVLDDAEGWGRLDLFSAANGYGALLTPTKVTMNARKGGFNARDTWRNNLTGRGMLIKQGTGSLTLAGKNTFTGGIKVNGGTLNLAQVDAAGKGQVQVQRGTLLATKRIHLQRNYQQTRRGTLTFADTRGASLKIHGHVRLAGTLHLMKAKGLKSGKVLMTFTKRQGKFTHIKGLPKGWHVKYTAKKVVLVRR